MCTAITYHTKEHYFGRNLDLEYSYAEQVVVTPRQYKFAFRQVGTVSSHYAMIGMAYVQDGYPLYYEATNEKGLSMAGLNFPDNAYYREEKTDKKIAISELQNAKTRGVLAIRLKDGDKLVSAILTTGKDELLLITRRGKALRYSEEKVRVMGRSSSGLKGIKLATYVARCIENELLMFYLPMMI